MIHHLCHDSSEVNIKGQKVGSSSVPENLHSFPEIIEKKSSHSLAYEITQTIKTSYTIIQGLSPSELVHALSVECVSL